MHKTADRSVVKGTRLRNLIMTLWMASLLGGGVGGTPSWAAQPETIDPRRSLVATEQMILARFSFDRVMNQLVAQSGVPGLTALALFNQWWDTQNCDGEINLNGYPYTCRPAPAEGIQATSNPFTDPDTNPDAYLPIGLFNRFDLAPADGSHCGEYRIVYAKRSGIADGRQRNLLIFEAILPNPHPNQGLAGCRTIVEFWAKLSTTDDINKRADDLERLYFQGLGNVEPVVHVRHYGDNANDAGQVRTNQFMQPEPIDPTVWNLREFKLKRTCSGGTCSAMAFIPVTDKVNPFGELHDADSTHPEAAGYRAHFLTQVEDLAASSLNDIRFAVPDEYNSAQSLASGLNETNYLVHFQAATDASFEADIQTELDALPSDLTPDHIIQRALSQSCAGCHRLLNNADIGGGLIWPASLGFTHVTERDTESVDGQERFPISNALLDVFLPQRQLIMEDYLNNKLKKPATPKATLSGRKTH